MLVTFSLPTKRNIAEKADVGLCKCLMLVTLAIVYGNLKKPCIIIFYFLFTCDLDIIKVVFS